jgi:hypothetical protein
MDKKDNLHYGDLHANVLRQIISFCINKQKSNEMHLDCLLYHIIPPTQRLRPNYINLLCQQSEKIRKYGGSLAICLC